MSGKRKESLYETIHVGRDGWLFLIGGTNRVLRQYRRSLRQWWLLRRWARLIETRSARARALGIRYVHTIVPEKLTIYDDRTDGLAYDPALSPARRLALRLMVLPGYVDLVAPLRAARNQDPPLYRATDTHWSYDGCLAAVRALLRACGAVAPADLAERRRITSDALGDLAAKLPDRPHEPFTRWLVTRDARRIHASPLVEAYEQARKVAELHVGAYVVYRNEAASADPRTVVLFGDSYAHFKPILLTGFLAECFRELHFVWSASLDWAYVERVRPDIVMVEMAERFLARVPRDDFDLAAYERADMEKPMRRAEAELIV